MIKIASCYGLAIFMSTLQLTVAEEHYVIPSDGTCPSYAQTCHNLTFYKDTIFKDNTVVNFIEGTYQLSDVMITVSNVSNVTIQGVAYNKTSTARAILQCDQNENGGIIITKSKNITLSGLTLTRCNSRMKLVHSSVRINDSCNVLVENVTIEKSTQNGLYIACSQDITLSKSLLTENKHSLLYFATNCKASVSKWHFTIAHSNITSSESGIYTRLTNMNFTVTIKLESSHISNNSKWNIKVKSNTCLYELYMTNTECNSARMIGMAILQSSPKNCIGKDNTISISITDSLFVYNSGVCFIIEWPINTQGNMSVTGTVFKENVGDFTFGVRQQINVLNQCEKKLSVKLENVTFEKNKHPEYDSLKIYHYTVSIISIDKVTVANCTFAHNSGPGLVVQNSMAEFHGHSYFVDNVNVNGGAISITKGFVVIDNSVDTMLIFAHNRAEETGGAIYVEQHSSVRIYDTDILKGPSGKNSDPPLEHCFFQMFQKIHVASAKFMIFQNNTAKKAGSAVYGGFADNCTYLSRTIGSLKFISELIDQPGDTVISSHPMNVYFCSHDNTTDSEQTMCNYTEYPGNTIRVPLKVVGNNKRLTIGIVKFISESSNEIKTESLTRAKCTDILYTVATSTTFETVNISTIINEANQFSNSIMLKINIMPCQKGFSSSDEAKQCTCDKEVEKAAKCYNSEQLIERHGKHWIGYDDALECVVVHFNCPFSYCLHKDINVTMDNFNVQCDTHRAGQLCGGCSDNYSLIFGSNKCEDCRGKNKFLALIILFAVAGIGLVCFLIFFNLTVSVGTINGLAFFVNVINIYQQYLPNQHLPVVLEHFLSLLSLDLGIETCFFHGMNALHKVALQFVFPFYLWFIIIVISFLSKYIPKLANLIGKNCIQVLATLIVLSYTKIIRNVILVFSFVTVKCGNESIAYWYMDPTQKYLNGGHVGLFILTLLILIVFITPYTLFLLLYPVMGLINDKHRQHLSWLLLRLKPFFDAYKAPYTRIYCFWPGALLGVRMALAMTVAFSETEDVPLSLLFAVLLVITAAVCNGRVYMNKYIHIIDGVCLGLLMVLTYWTQVQNKQENHIHPLLYGEIAIVSVSFIVFLGVILYHTYKFTRLFQLCKARCFKYHANKYFMELETSNDGMQNSNNRLRETLLDDD